MAARNPSRVDLQALPRIRDGWTFLYVHRARIERDDQAIVLHDERGRVPVPASALSALLLGPGVAMTHAAMVALADSACSVIWCGEGVGRFYASGHGTTHRSANLLRQIALYADEESRLEVVKRLYAMRFADKPRAGLTLQQLRGKEGARVRDAYARVARETGIAWSGRSYKRGSWASADPVNRALSTANACLYAMCHAAVVSTGFSPAIGFIHTGKLLSFVYDVADLYKVELTVPLAFRMVAFGTDGLEKRTRRACREVFHRAGLVSRLVPDVQTALGLKPDRARLLVHGYDEEEDVVGLWDPAGGEIGGGRNFAEVVERVCEAASSALVGRDSAAAAVGAPGADATSGADAAPGADATPSADDGAPGAADRPAGGGSGAH